MAVVESTFVLRSAATAELEAMQAKAVETEASFVSLGDTMDASMAKGSMAAKGAAAAQDEHAVAADASALAATKAAAVHESAAKKVEKSWSDSGSSMVKMGKVVVASLLAVGAVSLDMGVKFQASTELFRTQAGATQKQVGELRKGILDMAGAVGFSPQSLSTGMYHVVSSMNALLPPSQRVSSELQIMKAAAEGAKVGHADLEDTTYTLVSAMNALHEKGSQAATTMANLNAIVGAGDMTMTDLEAALKSGLIPTANTYHLSLQSVGAALAVLGDQGMRGAMAGTRLRMSLALLASPAKEASERLKDIGLTSKEAISDSAQMSKTLEAAGLSTTSLSEDLKKPDGLKAALVDLDEHLKKAGLSSTGAAAEISRSFGGGRSGAAIALLAQSTERLGIKYEQIGATTDKWNADVKASYETLEAQFSQVESGAEALATKLGMDLIPVAEKGLHVFKETAEWFEHNEAAAKGLAVVLGTVMVASVTALAVNVGRKLLGVTKDFYNFGKSIAQLPNTVGSKVSGLFGGGPESGEAAGAESMVSRDAGAATWGLRSMTGPGSELNPLVVTFAGAGLGGGAGAAVDEEAAGATLAKGEESAQGSLFADEGAQGTLFPVGTAGARYMTPAAEEEAAASPTLLARLRGGAGSLLGGVAGAGVAGGMGYLGAQLIGGVVGGKTGSMISGSAAGAGVGAAVGSLIAPGLGTWVGAIAGGALQTALKKLGAHGSLGDIGAGAVGGALLTAPLAAVSGPAAPVVAGLGAILGGAMGAFTGTIAAPGGALAKADMARTEAALKGGEGKKAIEAARELRMTPGETELSGGKLHEFEAKISSYIKGVETAVATNAGEKAANEWAKGWQSAITRGESPISATHQLTAGIKMELDKLGPVGRSSLAASLTKWTQQVAKAAPEMAGPMKEVEQEVAGAMTRLGQKVTIVNGTILTGSTQQWNQISAAITNPTQIALEKLNGSFSQMQQEALGALTQMGYSPSVARGILHDLGQGPGGQQVASEAVKAAQKGQPLMMLAPHGAKGMRVPGGHGPDSVGVFGMGGGLRGVVAPGELLVANRHTEARVNNMLGAFGTTLGAEVASETTPHYATGGIMGAGGGGSHYEKLIAAANRVSALNLPYVWGGGHETPAQIGSGMDCSGSVSYAIQQAGYPVPTETTPALGSVWPFPHGRGQATIYYKGGPEAHTFMQIGGRYWGTSGFARPNGGAGWFDQTPPASYLSGFQTLHLPDLGAAGSGFGAIGAPAWNGPGGVLGAVGVSLGKGVATAINSSLAGLSSKLGMGGGGGGNALGDFAGGGSPKANEALAKKMMVAFGYGAGEWPYLDQLWTRESGFNEKAVNPSSGAAGIAQELGHGAVSKTASGQIGWGLDYIHERYGTPKGAWGHETGFGWYDKGGHMPAWGGWHSSGGDFTVSRPTYIGVGDGGTERVRVTPSGRSGFSSGVALAGGVSLQVNIDKIVNNREGDIANIVHAEFEALARMIEQEHDSVPHEADHELLI